MGELILGTASIVMLTVSPGDQLAISRKDKQNFVLA